MKKFLIAAAVVGVIGYGWVAMHDGAYDPNAKYVGNTYSYKFHKISCRYVKKMAPDNKFFSLTREKLVKKGMKPCGHCKP